jgi:ferredoxin
MLFPKRIKIIDESQIKIEHKYLINKYELILDRLRCVGCGQCSIVCPTDAILFGPAAAVYENKPKDLNAAVVDSVDPDLCVMCGVCQAFCPFDAIHVIKDGEKVDPETLRISTYHSIPHLEAKAFACSRIKRDAQVYWEGETKATYEIPETEEEFKKYYLNKCPGDCKKCLDICPTDAITFKPMDEAWTTKILFEIEDDKCINCSACMLVCPQDNFKVIWTKIHHSGAYNQMFWDPIEEKLLKQEVKFTKSE